MRKIEAQFDTDIGIPNANTDKKERLITDEVNSNNVETQALLDLWTESLTDGAEEANRMFGLDIGFSKRYEALTEEKEVGEDGKSESYD